MRRASRPPGYGRGSALGLEVSKLKEEIGLRDAKNGYGAIHARHEVASLRSFIRPVTNEENNQIGQRSRKRSMTSFRFIHAADLHLDSPLIGLATKSVEYATRVDNASRQALDNLIDFAIEEECRLIVIAGDVFDGQWRDYRTGLFFIDRMRKLAKPASAS